MRHVWRRLQRVKLVKLNFLALTLPLTLLLAACSGAAPTAVAQVSTEVPTTAAPSATVGPTRTAGPTFTPLFPTFTETAATATRATSTPTLTSTPTETVAPLFTATTTPSSTVTLTPTVTPTPAPTNTPVPTSTITPTPQVAPNLSANPAYDREVQADQPAGYWRLDETSGTTAFDTSQGNHPGVYDGGYKLGKLPSAPGQFTSAASFDGSGQVTTNGVLPAGTAAWTVDGWFFQSGTSDQTLLSNGTGPGAWSVAVEGGMLGLAYGGQFIHGRTGATPDCWHYAALTYDGKSSVTIYLDGIPVYSQSGLTLTSSADFIIAGRGVAAGWAGLLADVAVYDHALPVDRLVRHYAAWFPAQVLNPDGVAALSDYDRAVLTAHPVDYWPLDSNTSDPQQASQQALANLTNGFCPASFSGSDYQIGIPGALAYGQGTGVSFGGNSQINICGRSLLPVGSSPRTVELWFKSKNTQGQTIFVYGGPGNFHLWEIVERQQQFTLHYWGNSMPLDISISPDVWHYAAVTYNGEKTAQIFLDGKLVGSGTIDPLDTVWDYVRIGGPGYSPAWQGGVDEVAVYDYVLSAATIADHYRLATNPPTVVF